MKNLPLVIFAIIASLASCDQSSADKTCAAPSCLNEKINQFKTNPQSIALLATQIKGECIYWFSTEAPLADGTDEVLNQKCETVCQIGGMRPNSYQCLGVNNITELKFDTLWHR